jgi:hypothetical protein
LGRVMRALAILFLVPGFSLGLVAGATHLVGPLEPVSAQQTSLVWANRVFTTKSDLESWLVSRGSNYELWSRLHPAAARHFDDASRSFAASSTAKHSRLQVQSDVALLIVIISSAVVLAMLALPRFVRSARFLLHPPSSSPPLRGPPPLVVATTFPPIRGRTRPPRTAHAQGRPRSAPVPEAVHFDWRKGWRTPPRLPRIAPSRVSLATRPNSHLVRLYLPRVTFYAAAVVLSFAIGAWVAIYLP